MSNNNFSVGDEVVIVMAFANSFSITDYSKAKITKKEKCPDGTYRYKLRGYSGWWNGTTLRKI